MAGAFTHFMICQEALKRVPSATQRLVSGLRNNLYIGAVSPDIPYLTPPGLSTNLACADYMHYDFTNNIAVLAVRNLHAQWPSSDRLYRAKAAWLLGYVSHLIADATIHPIVQEIVGKYEDNPEEHMLCEMVQDACVFKLVCDKEINEGNFIENHLSSIEPYVLEFWKKYFIATYFPDFYPHRTRKTSSSARRPQKNIHDMNKRRFRLDFIQRCTNTRSWTKWYTWLLGQSSNGPLKVISRKIGLGDGLFYRSTKDIPSVEKEKYFSQVKLPFRRKKASFVTEGFERTISNVLEGWDVVMEGIRSGEDITTYIKNWNLDTGADQSYERVTFWV